jgi:hypothetical protein
MGATSLKRKARKNRVVAQQRVDTIQRLQTQPVIKNVDVDAIKAEFAKTAKKPEAKKETAAKEDKAEAPKAKKAAAPKKKAAPKKTEDKKED